MKLLWLLYILIRIRIGGKHMNAWGLISSFLTIMGPDLKKAMVNGLQQWKASAEKTATPVDDLACNIMLFLLGA